MTDILEKLRQYNPPDRVLDSEREIAQDIRAAADCIADLRAQLAAKEAEIEAMRPVVESVRLWINFNYMSDDVSIKAFREYESKLTK